MLLGCWIGLGDGPLDLASTDWMLVADFKDGAFPYDWKGFGNEVLGFLFCGIGLPAREVFP